MVHKKAENTIPMTMHVCIF